MKTLAAAFKEVGFDIPQFLVEEKPVDIYFNWNPDFTSSLLGIPTKELISSCYNEDLAEETRESLFREYNRRGISRICSAFNIDIPELNLDQFYVNVYWGKLNWLAGKLALMISKDDSLRFAEWRGNITVTQLKHGISRTLEYYLYSEKALYYKKSDLRYLITRDSQINAIRERLNLFGRSIGSPYYMDFFTAKKIYKLNMVNHLHYSLDIPHYFGEGARKDIVLNLQILSLARNRKDFKRLLRLVMGFWGSLSNFKPSVIRNLAKCSIEFARAFRYYTDQVASNGFDAELDQEYLDWYNNNLDLVHLRFTDRERLIEKIQAGVHVESCQAALEYKREIKHQFTPGLVSRLINIKKDIYVHGYQPAINLVLAWKNKYNRTPSQLMLEKSLEEGVALNTSWVSLAIAHLDNLPSAKILMRYVNLMGKQLPLSERVWKAILLYQIFGKRNAWDWIEKYLEDYTLHDILLLLESLSEVNSDMGNFLFKYSDKPLSDVSLILNSWSAVWNPGSSFGDMLRAAAALVYKNVRIPELAKVCSSLSLSQHKFEQYQHYFEQFPRERTAAEPGMKKISYVPGVVINRDSLVMEPVDQSSFIGPMLGDFTDCCQRIGGVADSCARHGDRSEYGGFYVVKLDNTIIAQSWVWRMDRVLCFDNCEIKRGYGSLSSDIRGLYEETAEKLLGRFGIEEVLIGNSNDFGINGLEKRRRVITPPQGCYSDASTQYILARCKNKRGA